MLFELPENAAAMGETRDSHVHKVCSDLIHDNCTHEDITFEPFPGDNAHIFRSKNYYLTEDIVLGENDRIYIEGGVTNICLNGHFIKKAGGQIIDINEINGNSAALNICDCQGGGKIENTSTDDTDAASYAAISVIDNSELNVYSGTIDGGAKGIGITVNYSSSAEDEKEGTANIYGGTVQAAEGVGVWLSASNTSLNVYGGSVTSTGNLAISANSDRCNVTVSGGDVIGNASRDEAIYIYGENTKVTISGGSVIGNNYTAILCSKGTLEIKGGEVVFKKTTGSAVKNRGTLVLSDNGKITCKGFYGIWNYDGGKAVISGGTIDSDGAAIYNSAGCEAKIEDGDILSQNYVALYNYSSLNIAGGKITSHGYGAIWNEGNANLEISNGDIGADGYILCNNSGCTAKISEGTLTGKDTYAIQNYGNAKLTIGGGTIVSSSYLLYNLTDGVTDITGGELLPETYKRYSISHICGAFAKTANKYFTL